MSILGFFWLFLAVSFLSMAICTYRIKRTLMPKWFKESHHQEYWGGVDIEKIRPLFTHMLAIETVAFLLTAVSAIVEFLSRGS